MVPSGWVVMEELPVKGSGKIDPKDLPKEERRGGGEEEYEGARSEVEAVLCRIWEGVLGVERVGGHESLLELGGDSIISIQVITRGRKEGLYLTPRQVVGGQVIAELAMVAGMGR